MKRSRILFLAFACVLMLQSCYSPRPVLKVTTTEKDPEWNRGRAIISETKNGIETRIGFEGYDKYYLIFNVEITNLSNEKITVTPEKATLTDSYGNFQARAIDPEQKLFNMDIKASKKEASRKNGAIIGGVVLTAAVVTAVALDGTSNCDTGNDYFIYSDHSHSPNSERPVTDLSSFWKDEALRKTDLNPGYRIHGRLIFTRKDNLEFMNVKFPVQEEFFEAGFNQQVIKP